MPATAPTVGASAGKARWLSHPCTIGVQANAAHYVMANKQTNTPAPAATPAKAAAKAPAALALPAASVVASPAKGRTTTMAGAVGATYAVACTLPATAGTGAAGAPNTVLLPYQLPAWAGKAGAPVTVVVASTAPNWLGRNGHPLQCTVYHSPAGCVVVQPHAKGVQVNAYPQMPGHNAPIAVHGMQAATQAAS